MTKKMIVLLPQPIEAEAVQVLEKGNAHLLTASEPKPEIVGPLMKEAQADRSADRHQDDPGASRVPERTDDDLPYGRRRRQRRHSRRDRKGDHRDLQHRRQHHIGRRTRPGADTGALQTAVPDGLRGAKREFRDTLQELPTDLRGQDDRDRRLRADRVIDRPGLPHRCSP